MFKGSTPLPGAKNVLLSMDGKVMYISCDLSKDFGVSSSGKSIIIASSCGSKPLGKSNAFLGLNLFTKTLAARDLSVEAVSSLRRDEFQPVGDGCAWRIEPDAVTLCIKVDFANVTPRQASSGKSVLLATSSGNKPIGKTGISCGFNCHHSTETTFDQEALAEGGLGGTVVTLLQTLTLGDGYTVRFLSEEAVEVAFAGSVVGREDTVAMPVCRVGEATITMYVSPLTRKKARSEGPVVASTEASATGGVVGAAATKLRNAVVTCRGAEDALEVNVRFDPSQSLGRSSSGKSITVSTTAGFQEVVAAGGSAPICRLQFNVFRPAPPVTLTCITEAVRAVLSAKPQAELGSLGFNVVMLEILAALGLGEGQADGLRNHIKTAVKHFMAQSN